MGELDLIPVEHSEILPINICQKQWNWLLSLSCVNQPINQPTNQSKTNKSPHKSLKSLDGHTMDKLDWTIGNRTSLQPSLNRRVLKVGKKFSLAFVQIGSMRLWSLSIFSRRQPHAATDLEDHTALHTVGGGREREGHICRTSLQKNSQKSNPWWVITQRRGQGSKHVYREKEKKEWGWMWNGKWGRERKQGGEGGERSPQMGWKYWAVSGKLS